MSHAAIKILIRMTINLAHLANKICTPCSTGSIRLRGVLRPKGRDRTKSHHCPTLELNTISCQYGKTGPTEDRQTERQKDRQTCRDRGRERERDRWREKDRRDRRTDHTNTIHKTRHTRAFCTNSTPDWHVYRCEAIHCRDFAEIIAESSRKCAFSQCVCSHVHTHTHSRFTPLLADVTVRDTERLLPMQYKENTPGKADRYNMVTCTYSNVMVKYDHKTWH